MRSLQHTREGNRTNRLILRRGVLAAAVCAALGGSQVMAASATWTGATSTDWATGTNWSPAGAPGDTAGSASTNGDTATFNSNTNLQVNPDANRAIKTLTFGTSSGNYTIGPASGANTLYLVAGGTISNGSNSATTVTINSPLYVANSTNVQASANKKIILNGDITLATTFANPNGILKVLNTDGTVDINGSVSGPGALYWNGTSTTGVTNLNNANTNSGGLYMDVAGNTVNLNHAGAVTNAPITIGRGGYIVSNASNAITGTGSVSVAGYNASAPISSMIINYGNDYTGNTSVGSAGNPTAANSILLANNASGSATGSGNVAVGKGTLGGNGFIANSGSNGVTIGAGGLLTPGASAGTVGTLTMSVGSKGLDISGAVSASNSQSMLFDLNTPGASDKVALTGQLKIGTGTLELDDFAFNALGGFGAGTYTLFQTSTTISGTLGSNVTGTVGGLSAILGLANNNQDVVLTVVPEPGTLGVLAIGALGLLARRRRTV